MRRLLSSHLFMIVALLGLSGSVAFPSDIFKQDNADNLNLGSSWMTGTVPNSTNVAVWNHTVSAANSTLLGDHSSWAGIRIANPAGWVTINGDSTLWLGASGIVMRAATQNLTMNNFIALSASQNWEVQSGRTLSVAGSVNGNGHSLTLSGAGTKTLTAPLNHTDLLILSNGLVNFRSGSASSLGNLLVCGDGEVGLGSNPNAPLSVQQSTTLSNGSIRLAGRARFDTAGLTLTHGGHLNIAAVNGNNTAITIGSSGLTIHQPESGAYIPLNLLNINSSNRRAVYSLNGDVTLVAHPANTQPVVLAANAATGSFGDGYLTWNGARRFDVGDGGSTVDLVVQARIAGDTAQLIKSGPGSMALVGTGSNIYAQGTIVSDGVLLVNNGMGSGTGGGTVTVEAGATLGGEGTIAGAVAIENWGTLAPGNPIGTLTTGSLSLDIASVLVWDLATPWVYTGETSLPGPNDFLMINGDVWLDGRLKVSDPDSLSTGVYTLAKFTGALFYNALVVDPLPVGHGTVVVDEDKGLIHLVVSEGDAQTRPVITGSDPMDGEMAVSFASKAGRAYTLSFTTDLTDDPVVWMETDISVGDGNVTSLSDPDPVDPMRLYRITEDAMVPDTNVTLLRVAATPQQQMTYGMDFERLWHFTDGGVLIDYDELAYWAVGQCKVDYVRIAINPAAELSESNFNWSAYNQQLDIMRALQRERPDIQFFASPRPLHNEQYGAPFTPYPLWVSIWNDPFNRNGERKFLYLDWQKGADYYTRYLQFMKEQGFTMTYLDALNEASGHLRPGAIALMMDEVRVRMGADMPLVVAPSTHNWAAGSEWIQEARSLGRSDFWDVTACHNTGYSGSLTEFAATAKTFNRPIWNTEIHNFTGPDDLAVPNTDILFKHIRAGYSGLNDWLSLGNEIKQHEMLRNVRGQLVLMRIYYIFKQLVNTSGGGHYLHSITPKNLTSTVAFLQSDQRIITVWALNTANDPADVLIQVAGHACHPVEVRWWGPSNGREGSVITNGLSGTSSIRYNVEGQSLYCFTFALDP